MKDKYSADGSVCIACPMQLGSVLPAGTFCNCSSGLFADGNRVCQSCVGNCVTCVGSASNCTSCVAAKTLINGKYECGAGKYEDAKWMCQGVFYKLFNLRWKC